MFISNRFDRFCSRDRFSYHSKLYKDWPHDFIKEQNACSQCALHLNVDLPSTGHSQSCPVLPFRNKIGQ